MGSLAAATPAPGGGSGAAVACSLAAALTEMAAGFSAGSGGGSGDGGAPSGGGSAGEAVRRAGELRARALELADADLRSYAPVLEAVRRPRDDPERAEALHQALSQAAAVPYALVQTASEVSELAAQLTNGAGRHVLGDAATATVLAAAACRAAQVLVDLNLRGLGDERPTRAALLSQRAESACRRALSTVERS